MKTGTVLAFTLLGVALAPIAAKSADVDEQGRKACMYDALTVCAQYIPDRERIALCLMSNRERISEPCRVLISGTAAGTDADARDDAVKH
jgi:hypothetical protein